MRRLLTALAAFALYALASAWLTWPLAAHLTTHLPDSSHACRFDTLFTGWLLAYESHWLAGAPHGFAQANIYAPTPDALFYGPTCATALPFFTPVYLATGNPTLALNLLLLGGAALTATSLHLVVRSWTGSHAAGLVAAAALLTNRWLLWEFPPTAPIYALLFYFPVILWLLADPTPSWPRTFVLMMVVVAQELVHFGYIAPSVLGPLTLLAAVRIAFPRTRASGLQLALVVAVGALALAPELLAYRAIQRINPNLPAQTIWSGVPGPIDLPSGLIAFLMPTALVPGAFALIGLGAVLAGLRPRRDPLDERRAQAWRQAAFWAVAGTLIALPSTVRVLGHSIPTPRALAVAILPMLDRLRVPARLSLGAYIGLCALAGLAFAECERQLTKLGRSRRIATPRAQAASVLSALLLCALFLVEYVRGYGGPAIVRGRLPAQYRIAQAIDGNSPLIAILRQPGGPLLELPVGPSGLLPYAHTRAMYRSIFHWRPLVNGYDSYWPAAFPDRMKLVLALPDEQALAALRADTGLALVLVHTTELDPSERARWSELAERGERADLRLIARDGDDLLFATAPEPAAETAPGRATP